MDNLFSRGQFRHGDLLIDVRKAVVRRNGHVIEMPDLSLRVMLCLIKAAPASVSRDELAREVWEQNHVAEEVIAQRIALLRKALGDDPAHPAYIRTIRGKGYCWIASRSHASLWNLGAAAVFTILVISAGLMTFRGAGNEVPTSQPTAITVNNQLAPLLIRAREQLAVQQAEETNRAVGLFEEALHISPDSLDAVTGLSFALSTRATKFTPIEGDPQRAEELARTAIAMNNESAPAWHALGYALDSQGRVSEAIAAYDQSYALDPREMAARSSAAYLNIISGRFHSGLLHELSAINSGFRSRYAEIQIALALDLMGFEAASGWMDRAERANPGQSVVLGARADAAIRQGDARGALAILEQGNAEIDTERLAVIRGRALLQLGDHEAARQAFEAAGERGVILLAAVRALEGDVEAAQELAGHADQPGLEFDTWPESALRMAELMAALGEDERALRYLARAIDLGWRDWHEISESPFLSHLTDTQGGQILRRRVEREIEAQRQLVLADSALSVLIDPS